MSLPFHIEKSGTGSALALLHGWGMHSAVWGHSLDLLEQDWQVHRVDLPGHGHSPRPGAMQDIDDLADDLKTALPSGSMLVGWSLGGMVALSAALNHPDHWSGLVMVASSPRFLQDEDWPYGMPFEFFQQFEDGLVQDIQNTIDRFMMLETQGIPDSRTVLRRLRERVLALPLPDKQSLLDGLQLLEHVDLRDDFATLKIPALLIAGKRDRIVHPKAMEAAAATSELATFKCIPKAGHAPFMGHAEEFVALINAFETENIER